MKHLLLAQTREQVLSVKIAFILLPIVMLTAGFALGMFASASIADPRVSLLSALAFFGGGVISLLYCYAYFLKKVDRLACSRQS